MSQLDDYIDEGERTTLWHDQPWSVWVMIGFWLAAGATLFSVFIAVLGLIVYLFVR